MAESGVTATVGAGRTRGQWLSTVARQRELSLVAIMFVLGGLVSVTAPQFLTLSNLSQVAVLASIVAVAAVGEALVMITRNIDLSVEAMIGLVAYCVAIVLQRHALDAPAAIAFGIGIGLVLGMINAVVVGSVVLRSTRFGRQVYAVGSNPEAAAILGIPSRLVVFTAFSLCGLLAGVAGILWVMEFGTINGTSATGTVLSIVAAVVVGGVSTLGGIGTLAGAALGALFLGFIANALILVGLSQFWLQAIYGVVILVAISADAIILRRIQRATAESRARRANPWL